MPEYSFQLVTSSNPVLAYVAYERLKADGSLGFFEYGSPESNGIQFVRRHVSEASYFLAGFVDEAFAGFMTLRPWSSSSRCAYIGVAAFRRWYDQAVPLSQNAFAYCYEHLNVSSMIAHVVRTNFHVMRLCRACGFARIGSAPGMYYDAEHDRYESGHILLSTPYLLRAAMEV